MQFFLVIKREKMAKLEWEEGNKGRELVLYIRRLFFDTCANYFTNHY